MKKLLLPGAIGLMMLCFIGCGKPLPSLDDIDTKAWAEDKNACSGKRMNTVSAIKNQKRKLYALSENQIVELLGRPDHNELYKRNQKFYYYFLKPSPECPAYKDSTLQLVIRFNAMGFAKEVSIE